MPRSSSSCWFPNTYCRPSPSNLVLTGEATSAADCQEECGDTQGCEFFTFLRHRGSPQCSLLSSCTRYHLRAKFFLAVQCWPLVRATRCHVADSCVSGGPTNPAYMGQFLQGGKNPCFVSLFFYGEPSCGQTMQNKIDFSIDFG